MASQQIKIIVGQKGIGEDFCNLIGSRLRKMHIIWTRPCRIVVHPLYHGIFTSHNMEHIPVGTAICQHCLFQCSIHFVQIGIALQFAVHPFGHVGRLIGSINQLPAANIVSKAGFDEDAMDKLIAVAEAYGNATIYCTREFASNMVPTAGWVSDELRNERWKNGYLANYKGVPVIILPQSFEDEMNTRKVINPGYAWIIPTGSGNDKPVKIAFEGTAHMRDRENEDWSRDMQVYQKVGVGVIMTNNLCSYEDTALSATF